MLLLRSMKPIDINAASDQSQPSGPQYEQQQKPLEAINEVRPEALQGQLPQGPFKPPIHFTGPAAGPVMRMSFEQRLINFGLRPGNYSPVFYQRNKESIVNLAGLHRLNLHALQKELVEKAAPLIRNETVSFDQMADINTFMSLYVKALRDWDYMVERSQKAGSESWHDPFILTTEKTLDLCLMTNAGIVVAVEGPGKGPLDLVRPNLPGEGRGSYNQSLKRSSFWKRFGAAVLGSLALLGPMLLMVLHKGQTTSLATACMSVVLFALAVAFYLEESLSTVVGTVAAYTAVIVVFVGTSS